MNTIATWSIELNCTCPSCKKYVDLLDYPDFWDGRRVEAGENRTEKSINFEAVCPECGHEFLADLEL